MKKILSLVLLSVLILTVVTACGQTASAVEYKDGVYEAEAADYDEGGWKDNVTVTIKDGKIDSVDWNSINEEGDLDKKTASMSGDYGMVAYGDAIAEWHEQAELVEKFLLEKQDPKEVKTDAVAGVTIALDDFVKLVREALSKAEK